MLNNDLENAMLAMERIYEQEELIKRKLLDNLSNGNLNYNDNEPLIVRKLLRTIIETINSDLANTLKQIGIKASACGVFVHQIPYVRMKGHTEKVEIGDVLFVVNHLHRDKEPIRNALLYQVKKSVRNLDKTQDELYYRWPEFKYACSNSILKGCTRKITGPYLYNGARYLMICTPTSTEKKETKSRSCDFYTIRPHNYVIKRPRCFISSDCIDFIDELFFFLLGNSGRQFTYRPSHKNNWDQVITDLIDNIYEETLDKKPRGVGDLKNSSLLSYLLDTKDITNREENVEIRDDSEGFAILEINIELTEE